MGTASILAATTKSFFDKPPMAWVDRSTCKPKDSYARSTSHPAVLTCSIVNHVWLHEMLDMQANGAACGSSEQNRSVHSKSRGAHLDISVVGQMQIWMVPLCLCDFHDLSEECYCCKA